MADQNANLLTSLFPAPPTFYTHFITENLDRLATLQAEAAKDTENSEDGQDIVNAEARKDKDLRFLVPPLPPQEGEWKQFGDLFKLNDTLPSLPDQGIEQLYPSSATRTSTPFILKRLTKSLLLNFLELLGILSASPSDAHEKIEDIRVLFINFHHLCNEYRPHQTRETLVRILEGEVERCRAEVEGVRRVGERVRGVLGEIEGLGKEVEGGNAEKVESEEMVDEKGRWEEIFREFGQPGEMAGAS